MATSGYVPPVGPLRANRRPVRCAAERQALFSRIAPVYDNLNDLLSLGHHRIWKRMAVSWSGAKEGDNVLDLCCGSGDLAFLLSEKVGPNGRVIGLDFSKEQLSLASSRQHLCSKACYNNIKWVEGNALDLPFSDCHFDAVTMGYGLRNVIDKRKAMEEIYRILKPGSKASVLDFNKSTNTLLASIEEWMLDNIVVPVASGYGLAEEYKYLKTSIQEFLTGKELEELGMEVGFTNAKHYEIGGLMGNLVSTRQMRFLIFICFLVWQFLRIMSPGSMKLAL
ncbi:2-phytyl-1,4-beta-naphthoquinone methyltransferase, chloroplastic isoform X3 [Diospyros lotus]|uniref:2-phytyl-1,4-beta-naphthoquinone methyltransferase, chloroplastic isoform X3 n=1 Tax=Diospyros lotus TaxID=55363 RepID=UPI00224D5EE5|nr:2-phytyl-1,4-beta-naphthoquinone methyltransferase, chloroplastic isoform X3 [Diospyros lotus]